MSKIKATIMLVSWLLLATQVQAKDATLKGKVIGVVDGDTITVRLPAGAQREVRLQGIDAPERGQESGDAARAHLSGLILDKTVSIECYRQAGDDPPRARVVYKGADMSVEQVKAGFAWATGDSDHCADREPIGADMEIAARSAKRGLWAQANPIRPSDYRAWMAERAAAAATAQSAAQQARPANPQIEVPEVSDLNRGGGTYESDELPGDRVRVRGYRRRDGTYVRPHTRRMPQIN